MWVNVRFFDGQENLVTERGAYDEATATLSEADTKVYEAKIGIDAVTAPIVGYPEGAGFHLALSNKFYKDNRIPARGFNNAAYAAAHIAPVGATYADGQYWDDTAYRIPGGARRAEVRVFYQVSSRDYMEFLRDTNMTDAWGQIAYEQWEQLGKSQPVLMDFAAIDICAADFNSDGFVDFFDFDEFVVAFEEGGPGADFNGDGFVDFFDFDEFVVAFETGC
jgi:hypothetical protein